MKAIGIVLVFWTSLLSMLWVSGCSSPQGETREYHPFVGCWQSEDGLAIEGWTQDPSGWLFGYAVNRDETNAVKFFEQMRMDGPSVLHTFRHRDGWTRKFRCSMVVRKWILKSGPADNGKIAFNFALF